MGNCQAAEDAAVAVIHHPGGTVERIHWSITAAEVMNSNPGHYVAQVVVNAAAAESGSAPPPVRQLKLLRPGDTLDIGLVYRLISFEDVLKVFAAKKSVRLGKLLKESGSMERRRKRVSGSVAGPAQDPNSQTGSVKMEQQDEHHLGNGCRRSSGPWRPVLQSISELG